MSKQHSLTIIYSMPKYACPSTLKPMLPTQSIVQNDLELQQSEDNDAKFSYKMVVKLLMKIYLQINEDLRIEKFSKINYDVSDAVAIISSIFNIYFFIKETLGCSLFYYRTQKQ